MRVAQQFSTWGNKLDLSAVAHHPPSTFLAAPCPSAVVVDTVVISTQRGQIRRIRLTTILMRINVVDLAAICWHFAVRPRAHQVFCHGQVSLLS